jgi:hypothetical protein
MEGFYVFKILKLQGVSFDWDKGAFPKKNFPVGRQVGLIAQETEKSFRKYHYG